MSTPHSLDDHRLGVHDADHEHGEDSDHDHDDPEDGPGGVDMSLWMQDNVVLHSVGIDIGSSSTQVVFSKLHLQRVADQLSTRYVVVLREPLAQPPLTLTPYQSETLIDAQALGAMIEAAYAQAGFARVGRAEWPAALRPLLLPAYSGMYFDVMFRALD